MDIKERLKDLPTSSGVYIYYDDKGNVLYVGKAKVLKNRIKQYFQNNVKPEKVAAMLSHVADFKFIVTTSENDAFSLENTLIKKHKPPYNIMLKDDKQYSYLKIDLTKAYPKMSVVRKIERDRAKYFGPITGSGKQLAEVVQWTYPLATCNLNFEKLPKNFRPCLNFHIGRCCAPCIGNVSKQQYAQLAKQAIELLKGNDKQTREFITAKMLSYSEEEKYELALECKNYLDLLDKYAQSRIVALPQNVDYDIFALAHNGKNSAVNVMLVRKGKVFASENYNLEDASIELEQSLTSFIGAYYQNQYITCQNVLTSVKTESSEQMEEYLSSQLGAKVTITMPQKGVRKKLTEMSYVNAETFLDKSQTLSDKAYNSTQGACEMLQNLLGLKNYPRRIECYDISNISGVDKVASMVVFTNGEKDAKAYRRFKITSFLGADDFRSMNEVLKRRCKHILDNDLHFGEKPDLIVVDGGKGQLSSAREALEEAGISDIELISLAKRYELVFTLNSSSGIALPYHSYAQNLLINIRDEAHRFAITFFRQLHTKNGLKSQLINIEGIGEKRQIALIRHFKNIDNIKQATLEQLESVENMTKASAKSVYDYFKNQI